MPSYAHELDKRHLVIFTTTLEGGQSLLFFFFFIVFPLFRATPTAYGGSQAGVELEL